MLKGNFITVVFLLFTFSPMQRCAGQQYLVVLASDVRIYDIKQKDKLVYHSSDEQPLLIALEMKEFTRSGECRVYRIRTENKWVSLFSLPDNEEESRRFLFKDNVIGIGQAGGLPKSYLVSEDFKSVNINNKTGKLKDGTTISLETDIMECSDSCLNYAGITLMQRWINEESNEMDGTVKGEYESIAFSLGSVKPGILFLYGIDEEKLKKLWKPTPYSCLFQKR